MRTFTWKAQRSSRLLVRAGGVSGLVRKATVTFERESQLDPLLRRSTWADGRDAVIRLTNTFFSAVWLEDENRKNNS
jgi:hypothetical protein